MNRKVGLYRFPSLDGFEHINPPFHPDVDYPEYSFRSEFVDKRNYIYAGVRDLFYMLGLDKENYGTSRWNPFQCFIQPGDKVLIKPNLVISEHPNGDEYVRCAVTHAVVIRCLIDYTIIALKGQGRIVIGDSPIKETNFRKVLRLTGLDDVVNFVSKNTNITVELIDFRDFYSQREGHAMIKGKKLRGDPHGYKLIDLGQDSELSPVSRHCRKFRSTAVYYENVITEYHNPQKNIYSIPNSVLESTVFINVPKFKTHCKAGVTLSLKNLIGITNEKRWIPHHRKGMQRNGGDEYAEDMPFIVRLKEEAKDLLVQNKMGRYLFPYVAKANKLSKILFGLDLVQKVKQQNPYQSGGWYGNDTIWRTVLDLNKILLYADRNGIMRSTPQRKYFTFVEGLIAGEKEGPLTPSPKICGVIAAGFDAVNIDAILTTLMGFNYKKIPKILNAYNITKYPLTKLRLDEIELFTNVPEWNNIAITGECEEHLNFEPPEGWKGHIEIL